MAERAHTETTRSADETQALGERLGKQLGAAGVVWLRGPLGSGKTLLAKGLFQSQGIDPNRVTSPSFTLVNRYRDEPTPLYHIDLYRLDDIGSALDDLGLEDLIEDGGGLTVIEWGERLAGHFVSPDLDVTIRPQENEDRRIELCWTAR